MKPMTIREFFKVYSDDETCLNHIFECRFGDHYACPKCEKKTTWHRIKAERAYSCASCGHHLHPTVGTPFEKSRTSLQLWFYAIYLFTQTRHGVSAKELQRQLGVTYKCAWRMGHEIRQHMADVDDRDLDQLRGHVEIDETYIGGKIKNKGHKNSPFHEKTVVLGMLERDGDVVTTVLPEAKKYNLLPPIMTNVEDNSVVTTDGLAAYKTLGDYEYTHETVDHTNYEWARGIHHTNSIEGYWANLKRSVSSTHIHISKQHTQKYLDEFEYRHNARERASEMFPELISVYPEKDPE